jgi:dTDP-4-dehydrorhamnose reductase
MAKPKVLITGASGFIGSRLARDLSQDWDVVGTCLKHGAPGFLRMDILDMEGLPRFFEQVRPSAVIHAAAMAGPDDCERDPELAERINREAAVAIARECARLGARLIHFSTDLVFDGTGSWYKETDATRPVNVYARTKLEAEQAILARCPGAAILRVASVYGRALGGRPSFLDEIRAKFLQGQDMAAFVDQWRTATPCAQVPKVVAALLKRTDLHGVFHWGGATRASRRDFCVAVCKAFGFSESLVRPSKMADVQLPAARPADTSLDSSKLAKVIGMEPWSLEDGLARARREWETV